MTTLSIGLSILVTIALLILLLPIAMKSQLKTDTPAKKAIIAIAIFVPVFTMASYFSLGTPEFAKMATEQAPPPMTTLVDELELKLAQKPKDVNGWLLLGRSYMVTENYPKAIHAFEKALALESNNLEAILPLADALAVTAGGNLSGRPYQLLLQAYEQNPKNEMTLWLLGMAEKQLNNKEVAQKHWQALYNQLPTNSKDKPSVASLLASVGVTVESTTIEQEKTVVNTTTAKTTETTSTTEIKISFEISDEVRKKISGANVFIYAKQPQGMPMPIAAQRYQADKLPSNILLTKADELMPSRTLEQFNKLIIGVKITGSDAVGKDELYKNEQLLTAGKATLFIIKL